MAIFGVLLALVMSFDKRPVGPDASVTSGMREWAERTSLPFWQWVTNLGEVSHLLPAYLILLAIALLTRRWEVATFVALAPVSTLLTSLMKVAVDRPRPDLPVAELGSLDPIQSFPSGHSNGAMTFAAVLFCVVAMSLPGIWRALAACGCAALALAVAASRLALGVHYVSDVLAAFALSIAWVVTLAYVIDVVRQRRTPHDDYVA